jgi:hypothetical protein
MSPAAFMLLQSIPVGVWRFLAFAVGVVVHMLIVSFVNADMRIGTSVHDNLRTLRQYGWLATGDRARLPRRCTSCDLAPAPRTRPHPFRRWEPEPGKGLDRCISTLNLSFKSYSLPKFLMAELPVVVVAKRRLCRAAPCARGQ